MRPGNTALRVFQWKVVLLRMHSNNISTTRAVCSVYTSVMTAWDQNSGEIPNEKAAVNPANSLDGEDVSLVSTNVR